MYTSRKVYEYISQQTNDPIVEWKTCAVSGVEFPIYQSDLDFYAKISPTFAEQRFEIPTPTLCPEERQRGRVYFRNERKLYKNKCAATGKSTISSYNPDILYKIYDQAYWWSDARDPMDYGFEFDFSKNFTEQFDFLLKDIPHSALCSIGSENSDYTNFALNVKNCYLVFGGGGNEDCLYCNMISWWSNDVDSLSIFDSQECYQCIWVKWCHGCSYIVDSNNCSWCILVEDCNGCNDCIMCVWLSNQRYYFHNQYVWPEKIKELKNNISSLLDKASNIYHTFVALKSTQVKVNSHMLNSQNCWWEIINDSYNCIDGFNINNCENCKHVSFLHNAEWSFDIDYASPYWANHSYNLCSSTGTSNSMVTFLSWNNSFIYYCFACFDCKDCFWCIWLRNKQYCVFNRQYTKEEYEAQVAKIVTHMQTTGERGEFFHPSLSPFGYNETVAQEYYPIEVKGDELCVKGDEGIDLLTSGYKWSSYSSDPKIPDTAQVLRPAETSDEDRAKLTDTDDILRQVILCEVSNRPYMIQKAELEFYRKHNLPIPRKHPDIRHEERMKLRPGRTLYLRTCDCCGEEMLSVYSQDHEWKVYCEKCYQDTVYS